MKCPEWWPSKLKPYWHRDGETGIMLAWQMYYQAHPERVKKSWA